MTSSFATNALLPSSVGRKHVLNADKNGIPINGQIPLSFQTYTGTGNESIVLEGANFLLIQSTLPDGPLLISTGQEAGNRNLYGKMCYISCQQTLASDLILDYAPGLIYVGGSDIGSNNYTIPAGQSGFEIRVVFQALDACFFDLVDNVGSGGGASSTLYSADGTLAGNRTITGANNQLIFTGTSEFQVASDDIELTPGDAMFINGITTNNATTDVLTLDAFNQVKTKTVASFPNDDTNIYNQNGTLASNRVVDCNNQDLSFINAMTLNEAGDNKVTNVIDYTLGVTGTFNVTAPNTVVNGLSNDDTDTRLLTVDAVTNALSYRNVSSLTSAPDPNRVIYVSTTFSGNTGIRYDNVIDALTAASALTPTATDPVVVMVYPGTYSSLVSYDVPAFVHIRGVGNNRNEAIFDGSGLGVQQMRMNGNSSVSGIQFFNTTNFSISNLSNGTIYIHDCTFDDTATAIQMLSNNTTTYMRNCTFFNGVITCININTPNTLYVESCFFRASGSTGVLVNGGSALVSFINNSIFEECSQGLLATSGSNVKMSNCRFFNCNTAIEQNISNVAASDCVINSSNSANNIFIQNNNSDVLFFSGESNLTNFLKTTNSEFYGNYYSSVVLDRGVKNVGELAVGTPALPSELAVGEGDSTNKGALFYTCQATGPADDGSGFTALTNLYTPTSGDGIFASTLANECFLIGFPTAFQGIKYQMAIPTANLVNNVNVLAEVRKAGVWEPAQVLVTDADTFTDKVNNLFGDTANNQLRLGSLVTRKIQPDLVTINGQELYWIRFRITSGPINSIPVMSVCKCHTNRLEINSQGFEEYFGAGQPLATKPIPIPLTSSVVASPANSNVFFGQDHGVSLQDNRFQAGNIDRIAFIYDVDDNIDTSKNIQLTVRFFGDDDTGGAVRYEVSVLREASFEDEPGALSNALRVNPGAPPPPEKILFQQEFDYNFGALESGKLKTLKTIVNIETVQTTRDTGSESSDLLFFRVSRLGNDVLDTYGGDVILTSIKLDYFVWNNGAII